MEICSNDVSLMMPISINSKCPFCAEIDGALFEKPSELLSCGVDFRAYYSPEHSLICAFPDRDPIVNSHILLCSKEHISCYIQAQKEIVIQLETALLSTRKKVTDSDGQILFFEHGIKRPNCPFCTMLSGCVDHAHLHVSKLPKHSWNKLNHKLASSELTKQSNTWSSLIEAYEDISTTLPSQEYILVGRLTEELEICVYHADTIPSQYLKHLILDDYAAFVEYDRLPLLAFEQSCRFLETLGWKRRKKKRNPLIAIDGPSGAGKSSVSKMISRYLNFRRLDTGIMYRSLTWLVLESGIEVEDEENVAKLASECQISLNTDPYKPSESLVLRDNNVICINGHELSREINTPRVVSKVAVIASQYSVRQAMLARQRIIGQSGGIVVSGRDIGTYVFPEAELKIFMTASSEERSRRRYREQLSEQDNGTVCLETVSKMIADRDQKDMRRYYSPLRKADDAITIQTDHLSISEVASAVVQLYREKIMNDCD